MSREVDDKWIRCFHPQRDRERTRLICFPHAGGSASYYFPLSALIATEIETLAVQYPGRQDRRREKCIENIPELARSISEALLPLEGADLAFFGHSMGALVAFEVVQRLQAQGAGNIVWFFASGRRAPSVRRFGDVHLRSDSEIALELQKVGGTDTRWLSDEELLATILPAIRSDYKAVETYDWRPMPLMSCPVTALVGAADPHTTADDAAAWRHHSSGRFDLQIFPGGHFYLDVLRLEVSSVISAAIAPKSRIESSGEASE
jgi:surfactin synthase thioesterase subunit